MTEAGRIVYDYTERIFSVAGEMRRALDELQGLGSEVSLRTALSSEVNAALFGPDLRSAVYASWEDLFQARGDVMLFDLPAILG